MRRQHSGQMVYRGFGRSIREVIEDRCLDTVDGTDVNDMGRGVTVGRFSLTAAAVSESEKYPLNVGIHDFVPTHLWKVFQWRTPGNASVVDENVQVVLFGAQCGSEGFDTG